MRWTFFQKCISTYNQINWFGENLIYFLDLRKMKENVSTDEDFTRFSERFYSKMVYSSYPSCKTFYENILHETDTETFLKNILFYLNVFQWCICFCFQFTVTDKTVLKHTGVLLQNDVILIFRCLNVFVVRLISCLLYKYAWENFIQLYFIYSLKCSRNLIDFLIFCVTY